jgi:hypothetical protein
MRQQLTRYYFRIEIGTKFKASNARARLFFGDHCDMSELWPLSLLRLPCCPRPIDSENGSYFTLKPFKQNRGATYSSPHVVFLHPPQQACSPSKTSLLAIAFSTRLREQGLSPTQAPSFTTGRAWARTPASVWNSPNSAAALRLVKAVGCPVPVPRPDTRFENWDKSRFGHRCKLSRRPD